MTRVIARVSIGTLLIALLAACAEPGASALPSASASEPPESQPLSSSPSPSEPTMLATTTEPADEAPPAAAVIHVGPAALFTPDSVTVDAAESLTIFLETSQVNEGSHHNFKIGPALPPELPIAESESFDREQSVLFTVTGLEPGTYAFWCSVDEHHSLGMHGTLVVEG